MSNCRHGRGNSKVRAAYEAMKAVMDTFCANLDVMAGKLGRINESKIGFDELQRKIRKHHSRFVKKDGTSPVLDHIYSLCTTEVLAGNMHEARILYQYSILIRASMEDESCNLPDNFAPVQTEKVSTDRGLVRQLAKQTRCNCLDQMAKETKSQAKIGSCEACRKLLPRKDQLQCSRCRVFYYCSRECQMADWKQHKWMCKLYSAKVDKTEHAKVDKTEHAKVDKTEHSKGDKTEHAKAAAGTAKAGKN
jgi:MYND finger